MLWEAMLRASRSRHGVVVLARSSEPLAPQVWEQERQARQRGFKLVLEISDPRKGAGRALERVWKRRERIAPQLLNDIYLLRITLRRFGFRQIFQLTPYIATGEPLLLAWSELGQSLGAPELRAIGSEAALLARLAAFFDTVRAGHRRSSAAHIPASAAELQRKFEDLRHAARLLRQPPAATPQPHAETKDSAAGQPTQTASSASELQRTRATGSASAPKSTAAAATGVLRPGAGQPTAAPHQSAPLEPAGKSAEPRAPEPVEPEPNSAVLEIASSWQPWLAAARHDFRQWSAKHDLSADGTLESLAELDAYADTSAANQAEISAHLASVAVYLADIVCAQRPARLYVDSAETQLLSSVKLVLEDAPEPRPIALLERLFEVLKDPERSIFGLGVELSRLR